MAEEDIYRWDHHSDQPHVIRNKRAKRWLYLRGAFGSIKLLLVSLVALPLAWIIKQCDQQSRLPCTASGVGLCINIESELPEKSVVPLTELASCASELGIEHILIRVPLSAADNLAPYVKLAGQFQQRQLLIDIMQDRAHIEDRDLLTDSLRKIFGTFSCQAHFFKIGNAINRRKWGFVSPDEYFNFFKTAQQLRDREFPDMQLLGGGIIDFELPNFARSLLHIAAIKYDGVAALLYVDRRGAPENTQLGADFIGKIQWFQAIMRLSRKSSSRFTITETNWPLIGTEPFAPAVGNCMVDEDRQAAYLVRYYLLAFASGQVNTVYWHQLVAPGYGLIDNRGEQIRKRKAYYALKTLNKLFADASIEKFETDDGLYILTACKDGQRTTAIWTNDQPRSIGVDALHVLSVSLAPKSIDILQLTGEPVARSNSHIDISGDTTYFVQQLKT